MEGSLYPNGVLVDQAALRRTETTKAAQIELNRVDLSSRGVVSGGVLMASGTSSNYNVAVFAGYTPRGDYIESTVADINESLALDTLGDLNYICAIYTEVSTKSQPHETDGSTYPTYSRGSYTLKALNATQYATLAAIASDDNLANDAFDRCLLLGTIAGAGAGVAPTAFVHPTTYDNILYAVPNPLSSITGVTITGVSPSTAAGTGTVAFTFTTPNYTISWASLGATPLGATTITPGGTFTITDSLGETITIEVTVSLLPTTASISESVVIHNLYTQDITRLTAKDTLHRTRIGTGYVTSTNPHGNRLDDFGGQSLSLLDEHQDVMHSNGIWSGSDSTLFAAGITAVGSDDILTITNPGSNDVYYVNGKKLEGLDSLASITFDAATVVSLGGAAADCNYFEVYVDDSAALVPMLRAKYLSSRNCTGTSIIDMSEDHSASGCDLVMTLGVSEYTFSWDGGSPVSVATSMLTTALTYRIFRLFRPDGVQWIDLCVTNTVGVATHNYLPVAGGPYTDAVTVYATPDLDQHMRITSFPYMEDSSTNGLIGYPLLLSSTNYPVDHRVRGTIGTPDIGDAALEELVYRPTHDHHESGIINNRTSPGGSFLLNSYAGTTAISDYYILGGDFYCNGKKIVFEGVDHLVMVPILDDKQSIYWVHEDGTIRSHDITTIGSGSLEDNLYYILGSSYIRDTYDFDSALVKSSITTPPYRYDRPQQGVPLFLVTAVGGFVTDICHISRAVGPHVQPWTVASRSTTVAAEYGSLYAAFGYAKYLKNLGVDGVSNSIDITVVGDNTVDRSITQPDNVHVKGLSANSNAVTAVSHVSATGSWVMGGGTSVSGLQLVHSSGSRSIVFKLADHCTIKDCSYTASAIGGMAEGTGITSVKISNNVLNTMVGLLSDATGASTTNTYWEVSHNLVSQGGEDTGASSAYLTGMINLGGAGHSIKDNAISTVNTNDYYSAGINGAMLSCNIQDNKIFIGPDTGSVGSDRYGVGIYAGNAASSVISGNHIVRTLASTVVTDIGIYSGPVRNTVINNNVSTVGIGILVIDSSTQGITSASIKNNTIHTCYKRGIEAAIGTHDLKGLVISGNTISDLSKASAVTIPNTKGIRSDDLIGIELYQSSSAGVDTVKRGISVINNIIENCDLGYAGGEVVGVRYHVNVFGTTKKEHSGLSINGNTVSRLDGTVAGTSALGIDFSFDGTAGAGTGSIYRDLSISGNNLSMPNDAGNHTDNIGVSIGGNFVSTFSVSNNTITTGYADTTVTSSGTGIVALSLTTALEINISGNSITANQVGIHLYAGDFSVSSNIIRSYSQGIYVADSNVSILNNDIVVSSVLTNESLALYGEYGTHGINVRTLLVSDRTITINNNKVKLLSTTGNCLYSSTGLLINAITGNCSIMNNHFTNDNTYNITGKIGGGSKEIYLVKISARNTDNLRMIVNLSNNVIEVQDCISTASAGTLVKVGNLWIDRNSVASSDYDKPHFFYIRGNSILTPHYIPSGTGGVFNSGFYLIYAIFDTFGRRGLGDDLIYLDTRGVSYINNSLLLSRYDYTAPSNGSVAQGIPKVALRYYTPDAKLPNVYANEGLASSFGLW